MDKWLDAYSKWPPMNQLLFSSVVVAASVLVLFLFGLWVIQLFRYIAIARHGWPGDDAAAESTASMLKEIREQLSPGRMAAPTEYRWCGTCHPTAQISSNGLPAKGHDWKDEQRQMAEEQAWLQEQMEQAQKEMEQTKNPCTQEVPAGHTHMGLPGVTVAKEVPDL